MPLRLPKTRGMRRREAAAWLARLQSGREPDVERRFQHWSSSDPRNEAAFRRVRSSYEQAGLLRQSRSLPHHEAPPVRAAHAPRPALAAALAAVVLVSGVLVTQIGPSSPAIGAAMLSTGVGEIRAVTLEDGSKLTLDTASGVEVDIGKSRRRAILRKGRARFEIRGSRLPFIVEAGQARISADGGMIDVERAMERTRVDVLAGRAEVSGDAGAALALGTGEAVTVAAAQPPAKARASATGWTSGTLEFRSTPLELAVARANSYSKHKIELAPGLAPLRVSGAFRAGDTAGLARALAAAFDLRIQRSRGGGWILSREQNPKAEIKSGG